MERLNLYPPDDNWYSSWHPVLKNSLIIIIIIYTPCDSSQQKEENSRIRVDEKNTPFDPHHLDSREDISCYFLQKKEKKRENESQFLSTPEYLMDFRWVELSWVVMTWIHLVYYTWRKSLKAENRDHAWKKGDLFILWCIVWI